MLGVPVRDAVPCQRVRSLGLLQDGLGRGGGVLTGVRGHPVDAGLGLEGDGGATGALDAAVAAVGRVASNDGRVRVDVLGPQVLGNGLGVGGLEPADVGVVRRVVEAANGGVGLVVIRLVHVGVGGGRPAVGGLLRGHSVGVLIDRAPALIADQAAVGGTGGHGVLIRVAQQEMLGLRVSGHVVHVLLHDAEPVLIGVGAGKSLAALHQTLVVGHLLAPEAEQDDHDHQHAEEDESNNAGNQIEQDLLGLFRAGDNGSVDIARGG